MQVEFKFSANQDIVLPLHHNHIIQGFIYNSFSDESFAEFLHDEGYRWKKRSFKLFTFSRLMGKFKIQSKEKRIIYNSPVKLVIASIKDVIIQDLVSNIIKQSWVKLGGNKLFLEEVNFEKYDLEVDTIRINMLSPVVAYHTTIENGKKRTHYLSPWQIEFAEQIKSNLLKKYEVINECSFKGNNIFEIKPLFDQKGANPNLVLYRGFVIKGWSGQFELKGDPSLLKIGFDAGIGAKNSMGHGCFEIINQERR